MAQVADGPRRKRRRIKSQEAVLTSPLAAALAAREEALKTVESKTSGPHPAATNGAAEFLFDESGKGDSIAVAALGEHIEILGALADSVASWDRRACASLLEDPAPTTDAEALRSKDGPDGSRVLWMDAVGAKLINEIDAQAKAEGIKTSTLAPFAAARVANYAEATGQYVAPIFRSWEAAPLGSPPIKTEEEGRARIEAGRAWNLWIDPAQDRARIARPFTQWLARALWPVVRARWERALRPAAVARPVRRSIATVASPINRIDGDEHGQLALFDRDGTPHLFGPPVSVTADGGPNLLPQQVAEAIRERGAGPLGSAHVEHLILELMQLAKKHKAMGQTDPYTLEFEDGLRGIVKLLPMPVNGKSVETVRAILTALSWLPMEFPFEGGSVSVTSLLTCEDYRPARGNGVLVVRLNGPLQDEDFQRRMRPGSKLLVPLFRPPALVGKSNRAHRYQAALWREFVGELDTHRGELLEHGGIRLDITSRDSARTWHRLAKGAGLNLRPTVEKAIATVLDGWKAQCALVEVEPGRWAPGPSYEAELETMIEGAARSKWRAAAAKATARKRTGRDKAAVKGPQKRRK